ncbi:MAG: dodecin domain-containing protein [Dehalococcoidia bacterium]|nr:dodecin domain-containing protein [Dehalococcoidia bacterium]
MRQIRGNIQNGKVGWYQVDMRVGFRLVEHGDAGKDA